MSMLKNTVISNPWQSLRQFTNARIALGRTGVSLPTAPQLQFQLAHARARDAVHLELETQVLAKCLNNEFNDEVNKPLAEPCIVLHSAAATRNIYLQRPDLGRQLDAGSRQTLAGWNGVTRPGQPYDVAFVIADGLSALAIEENALPFLSILMRRLGAENWSFAPLTIVAQGRVAIGDEVAELLGAKAVVVLIGERPGLSSPDSMGLYLTWAPRVGLTDEMRNCISNVRPAGLAYEAAAAKLHYLLSASRQRQLSGVALKDETPDAGERLAASKPVFML